MQSSTPPPPPLPPPPLTLSGSTTQKHRSTEMRAVTQWDVADADMNGPVRRSVASYGTIGMFRYG